MLKFIFSKNELLCKFICFLFVYKDKSAKNNFKRFFYYRILDFTVFDAKISLIDL